LVALRGFYKRDRWWLGCGFVLVVASFLSIRGGAPLFFGVVALAGLFWLLPRLGLAIRGLKPKTAEAAATAIVLACMMPWNARAAETPPLKPAESMVHDWRIRDGRLYGTLDVTLRADAGDRFLLLREPAVLGDFEGAGLRVVKAPLDKSNAYWLVADATGRMTGRATFEMPLAEPAKGWDLPGGPAAMRSVTLRWDQGGWEFFSAAAAKVRTLDALQPKRKRGADGAGSGGWC
jgi:hypothetical protein